MPIELITGAARSGKSRWAEQRLEHASSAASMRRIHYLATGPEHSDDPAWQERVRLHRERRPLHWNSVSVGFALIPALAAMGPADHVLVDSLGTWVSQGLEMDNVCWRNECLQLLGVLNSSPAQILLVSEQVGWGVVPATAIGGLFRDRLGALEEQISCLSSAVWLVVAGRALDLLPLSQPIPRL